MSSSRPEEKAKVGLKPPSDILRYKGISLKKPEKKECPKVDNFTLFNSSATAAKEREETLEELNSGKIITEQEDTLNKLA